MDSQPTLFGSVPSVAGALFSEDDRYRLFARKVWPVLAGTRAALEKCAIARTMDGLGLSRCC